MSWFLGLRNEEALVLVQTALGASLARHEQHLLVQLTVHYSSSAQAIVRRLHDASSLWIRTHTGRDMKSRLPTTVHSYAK
jgi:hypothetical protein